MEMERKKLCRASALRSNSEAIKRPHEAQKVKVEEVSTSEMEMERKKLCRASALQSNSEAIERPQGGTERLCYWTMSEDA